MGYNVKGGGVMKDVEGRDHGMFESTILAFIWMH
jgi:hypothetical protein